jgi:hypothetical protein
MPTNTDKPKDSSVRCVRDVRRLPLASYRMPDDGRKWKELCSKRLALANHLATFADADGTNIKPGVTTLMIHFGWSRRTVFNVLDDLKRLGMIISKGLSEYHGTRNRHFNPKFLELETYIAVRYTANPRFQAFIAALEKAAKKIGPLTFQSVPEILEVTVGTQSEIGVQDS